jgi:hypothetical protein
LDALAYSVVWWKDGGEVITVDTDVLRCRPLSLEGKLNPNKRSRVHQLVLSVVAERWPPTVVCIGPPLDPREPELHVQATLVMLRAVAAAMGVPIQRIESEAELFRRLDARPPRLGPAVQRRLTSPLGTRDRRIVLATAAAVAATCT